MLTVVASLLFVVAILLALLATRSLTKASTRLAPAGESVMAMADKLEKGAKG
jgi:hypothetical protein